MKILKNNKLTYYIKNYFIFFIAKFHKDTVSRKLQNNTYDTTYINYRVNYYNKLLQKQEIDNSAESIEHFYKTHKKNAYYFDSIIHLIYFNWHKKINYVFGDVTHVPKVPSFVKSRPISGDNKNSILLKLDKVRHYFFVNDKKKFVDKKNILVWRGDARRKPHRLRFLKKLYMHPLCDVGQTHKPIEDVPWQKGKLSIAEQLDCKFILCVEGYDVATNLKWTMSSNSLAFSYKMKYETWFMEGELIPNHHFVLIKDDLSDVEEKMAYYTKNPKEALKIIKNAKEHVRQFQNKKRERYISFLTIQKYFDMQK